MHKAALVALSVLLTPLVQAQPSLEVQFRPPAQAGGDVAAVNGTWALLMFDTANQAGFDVEFPASSSEVNATVFSTIRNDHVSGPASQRTTEIPVETTRRQDPFTANVSYAGVGSIYLHGKAIQVEAIGVRAELLPQLAHKCLTDPLTSKEREKLEARYYELCPEDSAAAVLRADEGIAIKITATGLDTVEWHNARITCHTAACPDGGQRTSRVASIPQLNATYTANAFGYHQLLSQDAAVQGGGRAVRIVVGGPSFDFHANGWARLPLARTQSCPNCVTAENETLKVEGNIALAGLHRDGDRLAARMGGTLTSARIDERRVSAELLFAGGVGVTLAAAAVVWFLLALFSHLRRNSISKRQRTILELIENRPGIIVEELTQVTGIPKSTMRHHVRMLLSGQHVMERRDGHKIRLFENHGRYNQNWQAVGILQEAVLRQLYDWLAAHPGTSRADLVRHARQAWGWKRNTTYHRLGRLEEAQLVAPELGNPARLRVLPVRAPQPAKPSGSLSGASVPPLG